MIKNFSQFNEKKVGDDAIGLDIDNEYTKLVNGQKGGMIEIGKVSQVADSTISNIKQTYKDAIVKIVNDRYVLMLK